MREAVAQAVYRSVFEQRLHVDGRAMNTIEMIARRINALKENDRELPARRKLLLDFLGSFRQGGARKPKSAEPVTTEAVATAPVAVAQRDQSGPQTDPGSG